jgi:hypothetical protein
MVAGQYRLHAIQILNLPSGMEIRKATTGQSTAQCRMTLYINALRRTMPV